MKWRPRAIADIDRLHKLLHEKNPQAAARATQAISDGAEILNTHPRIGRPMQDDSGRREWFISFGASTYALRYRLDKEHEPVILRVWHSCESRS